MLKLRSLLNSQTRKKKPKVRRKSGGERENRPMEKRSEGVVDSVRRSGTSAKKKSIVKRRQEKAPTVRVTPTEVAKSMKDKKGGKK